MGCNGSKSTAVPTPSTKPEQDPSGTLLIGTKDCKAVVQDPTPETAPPPPVAGGQAEPASPRPQKGEPGVYNPRAAAKSEVVPTHIPVPVITEPPAAPAKTPALAQAETAQHVEASQVEDTLPALGITVTGAPTAPAPVCSGFFNKCCNQRVD